VEECLEVRRKLEQYDELLDVVRWYLECLDMAQPGFYDQGPYWFEKPVSAWVEMEKILVNAESCLRELSK